MKEKDFKYIKENLNNYSEQEKKKRRKIKQLLEAVQSNDKETILELKKEISLSEVYEDMATALMVATANNNTEMIDFLLENGANPATILKNGKDVAWLALDMGNTNLFELFIKKGVVLNLKVNDKTRLIEAVENSNVKAVRILLNHGVNVEEKDKDGRTALHYNFIKDPYTENDRQIGILLTVVGLSPFEEDVNQIPAYGYLKNVKSVKDFIDIKNLPELPEYKLERIEKIKEKTKPRSDILAEYKDVTVKKISKPKSFASYYYPKPSGNKKDKN